MVQKTSKIFSLSLSLFSVSVNKSKVATNRSNRKNVIQAIQAMQAPDKFVKSLFDN